MFSGKLSIKEILRGEIHTAFFCHSCEQCLLAIGTPVGDLSYAYCVNCKKFYRYTLDIKTPFGSIEDMSKLIEGVLGSESNNTSLTKESTIPDKD